MTHKSEHTVDIDTALEQSVHLLTAYMIHQSSNQGKATGIN